jgi:hypothetical protein
MREALSSCMIFEKTIIAGKKWQEMKEDTNFFLNAAS